MLPISKKLFILRMRSDKDKYESALFKTVILIIFQLSTKFHAEK